MILLKSYNFSRFPLDFHVITWYNLNIERRWQEMENKINELKKVITALIQLALEIGTLLAVIKMIIESLQ